MVWKILPLKQGLKPDLPFLETVALHIVWKILPLKQGLKPDLPFLETVALHIVWKILPLKQGLKPSLQKDGGKTIARLKDTSIKTRIETCHTMPISIYSHPGLKDTSIKTRIETLCQYNYPSVVVVVWKILPLKQGLKRLNLVVDDHEVILSERYFH